MTKTPVNLGNYSRNVFVQYSCKQTALFLKLCFQTQQSKHHILSHMLYKQKRVREQKGDQWVGGAKVTVERDI